MNKIYGFSFTSGQYGIANSAEVVEIACALAQGLREEFKEEVQCRLRKVPNHIIDIFTEDEWYQQHDPKVGQMRKWIKDNWSDIAKKIMRESEGL